MLGWFLLGILLPNLWLGLLSCLRRVCQGSTNVSFQRSVLCVQERVQNASCIFFLEMVPKKRFFQNYMPTIAAVKTWCDSETSWLIAQGWWKIWKPGEFPKSWWTVGYFENVVETWWKPGEFAKPSDECQNLVKTWWKPGEKLVSSSGFHQTNERSVLRTEGFW